MNKGSFLWRGEWGTEDLRWPGGPLDKMGNMNAKKHWR